VSWVVSPTWTALPAEVKLSIDGGADGEPESPVGDEDPQPAARSEKSAIAPRRRTGPEIGCMVFRPPASPRLPVCRSSMVKRSPFDDCLRHLETSIRPQ
jgi:hypothetical protein